MPPILATPLRRSSITALLVCLLALALGAPARADIAPPEQPPGSNIAPEGGTQVQMAAEQVLLVVGDRVPLLSQGIDLQGVSAHITATFQMVNTGAQAEQLSVRFPLANPSGAGDGFFNYPQVSNLKVTVDGSEREWTTTETANPLGGQNPPLPWATFDVSFPPGQPVVISVRYDTVSTGFPPEARFNYVLETGAGWQGPIGQGDILLRLPYEANQENVLLGAGQTTPGGIFAGNEVRWHFENLEPSSKDNWQATIIDPVTWKELLDLRQQTQQKADDPQVWAKLGELTQSIALAKGFWQVRPGAGSFLLESEQAYARAVALAPDSSQLHTEYAAVLFTHYNNPTIAEAPVPSFQEIQSQINQALLIDPQNKLAWALQADIVNAFQLTATAPSQTTGTPTISQPAIPTPTGTQPAQPQGQAPAQITPSPPATLTRVPGTATVTIIVPTPTPSSPPGTFTPTVTSAPSATLRTTSTSVATRTPQASVTPLTTLTPGLPTRTPEIVIISPIPETRRTPVPPGFRSSELPNARVAVLSLVWICALSLICLVLVATALILLAIIRRR